MPQSFADVKARPGYARIRGQESRTSLNKVSILARKLTSVYATVTTKMEYKPEVYQHSAGLIIYYDNMNYINLRKYYSQTLGGSALSIIQLENGEKTEYLDTRIAVEDVPIYLRLQIEGRQLWFEWSYDGENYTRIGRTFDTTKFSDEYCKYGEFTGTFVGLTCADRVLHKHYAEDVYTIVLFEQSPEEFKHFPDTYIHRFEQESDTGLEMNLLQKYLFVPLDIFQKIQHNKNGEIKIANRLEAWLAFLCMDRPEEIIAIIEKYPDFKDLYSQIYDMCRNIEEVMAMFSKELLEMDRNTVQLMIDDMQKELDETKDELVGTKGKLDEAQGQLDETKGQLDETKGRLDETKGQLDEARNEVELLRRKLAELEGNR